MRAPSWRSLPRSSALRQVWLINPPVTWWNGHRGEPAGDHVRSPGSGTHVTRYGFDTDVLSANDQTHPAAAPHTSTGHGIAAEPVHHLVGSALRMPARSASGSATEQHDRGSPRTPEVGPKYKRIDRDLVQRGCRVTVQRVGHQVTHGLPLRSGGV